MRFDLVDLRLVQHVAESTSITHGAARAGMTLASASERIRAMEETLGTPLFERKRRGVSLTPAGMTLVQHARLVTQQMEQMRGELAQYAKGLRGRVRLFSNTAATQTFLPSLLGKFLSSHPNVDVDLEEHGSADIVKAVANGRADIGIVADAVDAAAGLETFPLAEDRLVLVTPSRHPLARRRRIPFAEAMHCDFVGLVAGTALQEHVEDHAARAGHRLRLRVRLPGFEAICCVVESGIGVAVVPRKAAQRCARTMALRAIPLTDPWARRHLRICVKSLRSLPPHGRWLVDHLRAAAL